MNTIYLSFSLLSPAPLVYSLIYCGVSGSVTQPFYWSLVAMLAGLTPLNPGWPSPYLSPNQNQTQESDRAENKISTVLD